MSSIPPHRKSNSSEPQPYSYRKGLKDGFGPGEIVRRRIVALVGLVQERAIIGNASPTTSEIASALGIRAIQAKYLRELAIHQGVVAVVGGKLLIVDQEMAS